jgi:transposase
LEPRNKKGSQDPDAGGRAKKVDTRWPKGGTKEYLGTSKKQIENGLKLGSSTSEPWNQRTKKVPKTQMQKEDGARRAIKKGRAIIKIVEMGH